MKPKIRYEVLARYSSTTQEWIAFETKYEEDAKTEAKRLRSKYPQLKVRVIKISEEVVKL